MKAKIRRVDFSADEWLAGTAKLRVPEKALYIDVLALIYSRGEPVDEDRPYFKRLSNFERLRDVHAALDRLLALGKLRRLDPAKPGGPPRLMNGRAEIELGKARHRIRGLRNVGERPTSDQRATNERPTSDHGQGTVSSKSNGLATTHEGNHQPSTNIHESIERVRLSAGGARARTARPSQVRPDEFKKADQATLIPTDWTPSADTVAQLHRGRPDLVGAFYDEQMNQFRLWCREHAVVTHDREASWLRFMMRARVAEKTREQRDAERDAAFERALEKGKRDFDKLQADLKKKEPKS